VRKGRHARGLPAPWSIRGAVSRPVVGATASLLTILASTSAWADPDEHARSAGAELVNVDREIGTVQAAVEKAKGEQMSVEERLANGELLYRTKDYPRAANVFSEILEKYPNTPSYPDALWLRGETYYASHEYLSARRDYRAIIDKATDPRFQTYFGRALARLVDVSLRVGDIAGLDEVFQKLGQVPPAQVDAGLNYAKGKAYFAKVDYANAQQAFQGVPTGSDYGHQAKYFLGLISMKQIRPATPPPSAVTSQTSQSSTKATPAPANYKPAIEVFRQVAELPPDTDDHRHVIDLAWMAIGRLFYEMEQYEQAADAYAHVSRESPEFDTMLYELAWVYVRIGDVQRAERALEVLQVADPGSPYVGDGTLLRADLLLRAGAFDKALQLYEGVRTQYDPMRVKVESFLDSTKDVGVYYEKLSQQQLDTLEQNEALPQLAVRWAREAEDGPAAFAVIDDVNQCKTLLKQSNDLIEKLSVLTNAANRVRAFPELEAGEKRALGLLNQVSRARLEIAKGLDDEEKEPVGAELAQVRGQRRALMAALADMPTTSGEFESRDTVGRQQWNEASQSLTSRNLEIDQLQAIVNGLRRMLRDDAQKGVARDPNSVARFQAEIDQNEHDLKVFHQEADELRKQINFGRAQVGLGDARYQNDAQSRAQFRDLLDREVQLAAAAQAGVRAQSYGQRVQPLLMQGRSEEDKLAAAFAALEEQVAVRTTDLRARIDAERANIASYTGQLDTLDNGQNGAHDLVGHVAERNFGVVRDKLRGIVLRADVGITEQAWEVREEEMSRVHNLQTERAREEQLLDEEQREVLDDANNTSGTP
jgi:tetratricopeptide (TPR) repeat protein